MFDPEVGKTPWRREQLPTPVFLSGEFHGQGSLEGYSPWGLRESDTTERLSLSLYWGQETEEQELASKAGFQCPFLQDAWGPSPTTS